MVNKDEARIPKHINYSSRTGFGVLTKGRPLKRGGGTGAAAGRLAYAYFEYMVEMPTRTTTSGGGRRRRGEKKGYSYGRRGNGMRMG